MGNDRLRAAISQAGLQIDDIAAVTGVDTKTVQRWLAGRTPYQRHRIRIAQALATTEQHLWPNAAAKADTDAPPPLDLVDGYPSLADPRVPDPQRLLRSANHRIELLDITLNHLLDQPATRELLTAKAAKGCEIRILISDLHGISQHTANQDPASDRSHPASTPIELENERARGYLQPLIGQPGIHIYEHRGPRAISIVRGDDQMLATLHLSGAPTADAPVLHLRRRSDRGIFERLANHFATYWEKISQPLEPDPDRYPDPDRHPERYQPHQTPTHQTPTHQAAKDRTPAVRPAAPPALQKQPWPRRGP